jgi:hypothetical protein
LQFPFRELRFQLSTCTVSEMNKIVFSAVIVLSIFTFERRAVAACNMGEDAKNITEINFGKLKLSAFSPGELRVTAQHALPDKDSWPFILRPQGNRIGFSASAVNAASTVPLRFEATMQVVRPITGFILERITPSGCIREIRVKDGDLNGNTIGFKSGTLSNSFGGTVPLAGLEWKVQKQEDVSDIRGNAEREIADCVSSHRGAEVTACFEKLAPGISKAKDTIGCVTAGNSPTQIAQCVTPIVGGDAAKIATCVTNEDKKAAAVCLLGDKPEVRQALQMYNCVAGGRDTKSIIANCSDGLIKDKKTREALACVSQSSGDRAQLASCAAGVALPPDAAHLVGCAASSQGPTSFALCAAGPAMNEEWRIAAECAVQSGGNPAGFAGCTAGRLTARELTKCFTGEFGKDCFGPENTLVKYFTNEFNDLIHGPGQNNEIVKGVKAIGELTGGPNSVVRNPAQLLGGPNSVFNNPSQIWGGSNSVFNNPAQVWGGPGSVFNDPGQVLNPSRWRF